MFPGEEAKSPDLKEDDVVSFYLSTSLSVCLSE